LKTLSIFIIAFFSIIALYSQNRQNIKEQIDKIIRLDEGIDFSERNDILIGVVVRDSTFIYHYGSKEILTDSSIFEIGGISKIFMATLVQKFVNENKLKLTETINLENEFNFNPTIESLLSHQSGLPRIPDNLGMYENDINNPYANYSPKILKDYYLHFKPEAKSQKNGFYPYTYSHFDYGILQSFIEQKFMSEYNIILNDYILSPLKFVDTKFTLLPINEAEFVQGHSPFGKIMPANNYNAFDGSIGLKSSMRDLLQLTRYNLGVENDHFLTDYEILQKPIVATKITKNAYMGLGWHIIKKKRYFNVCAHVGVTKGHSSIIAFVKETQTGVVILSSSSKKYNNLAFLVLRMLNFNWKKK